MSDSCENIPEISENETKALEEEDLLAEKAEACVNIREETFYRLNISIGGTACPLHDFLFAPRTYYKKYLRYSSVVPVVDVGCSACLAVLR
ncbi:hypothetical protein WA026_007203 [Henosepilachna vigintioctopunctata]|uniref:Uncharacterized protein n=1 Tax=Henosepilachna vigintioctopunctata TaxID=420089 RepID=A0AAW1VAT4_9CUCU